MNPKAFTRVTAYQATDGSTFTGQGARQRCAEHQANLDNRAYLKGLLDANTDVQDGAGIVDGTALLNALLDPANAKTLAGLFSGIAKRTAEAVPA